MRPDVSGTPRVGFGTLVLTTVVGGVVGALLLLRTPVALFDALVPGLVLVATGLPLRRAGASKNVLVSVTNGAAVVVFLLTARIAWPQAAALGAGAIVGGLAGALALRRVNERALRIAIVGIGLALSVGLALRAAMTR